MSERVKLQDAGAELVMQVKTVNHETVENTEYVKFDDGRVDLLVPQSSVERQFERLGVDTALDIAGMAIKFSRSTKLSKYGKPFWNLDLASKADLAAKAPSKRLSAPPTASEPPAHHRESGIPNEPPRDRLDDAMDEAGLRDESAALHVEFGEKQEAVISGYLRLYARVAVELCAMGKANDFPVDGTSINAATATISISLDKRNLSL